MRSHGESAHADILAAKIRMPMIREKIAANERQNVWNAVERVLLYKIASGSTVAVNHLEDCNNSEHNLRDCRS